MFVKNILMSQQVKLRGILYSHFSSLLKQMVIFLGSLVSDVLVVEIVSVADGLRSGDLSEFTTH